jgi:hypothetical protein
MMIPKPIALTIAFASCVALLAGTALVAQDDSKQDKKKRPSISIKANPASGFSPLKVVVSAELKGGADDYEEFYCPTVEWTWGDDTKAESTADCEPYESGKSAIKRRYTVSRVFHTGGEFKVEFRLKQKQKVVGSGSTTIQVRPGVRDGMCCG